MGFENISDQRVGISVWRFGPFSGIQSFVRWKRKAWKRKQMHGNVNGCMGTYGNVNRCYHPHAVICVPLQELGFSYKYLRSQAIVYAPNQLFTFPRKYLHSHASIYVPMHLFTFPCVAPRQWRKTTLRQVSPPNSHLVRGFALPRSVEHY